ncbi:hypothetical protein EDD86DRAFT_269078, partial [Gorgonomyces haynaldii]
MEPIELRKLKSLVRQLQSKSKNLEKSYQQAPTQPQVFDVRPKPKYTFKRRKLEQIQPTLHSPARRNVSSVVDHFEECIHKTFEKSNSLFVLSCYALGKTISTLEEEEQMELYDYMLPHARNHILVQHFVELMKRNAVTSVFMPAVDILVRVEAMYQAFDLLCVYYQRTYDPICIEKSKSMNRFKEMMHQSCVHILTTDAPMILEKMDVDDCIEWGLHFLSLLQSMTPRSWNKVDRTIMWLLDHEADIPFEQVSPLVIGKLSPKTETIVHLSAISNDTDPVHLIDIQSRLTEILPPSLDYLRAFVSYPQLYDAYEQLKSPRLLIELCMWARDDPELEINVTVLEEDLIKMGIKRYQTKQGDWRYEPIMQEWVNTPSQEKIFKTPMIKKPSVQRICFQSPTDPLTAPTTVERVKRIMKEQMQCVIRNPQSGSSLLVSHSVSSPLSKQSLLPMQSPLSKDDLQVDHLAQSPLSRDDHTLNLSSRDDLQVDRVMDSPRMRDDLQSGDHSRSSRSGGMRDDLQTYRQKDTQKLYQTPLVRSKLRICETPGSEEEYEID